MVDTSIQRVRGPLREIPPTLKCQTLTRWRTRAEFGRSAPSESGQRISPHRFGLTDSICRSQFCSIYTWGQPECGHRRASEIGQRETCICPSSGQEPHVITIVVI